ncbi:DHA2 family efflux MFS transporter permease subunit [Legionella sp. CNM-4043-24]|uniref:DHA2 family efflux MFS transporter permease subunit n=1 Tax=Legionella sp. CNM-4043-24 TaxID=3421646 RepID=UPI00403B0A21
MKKNLILLIVSFAMFMEAMDTTIINTAIPVMAESMNVNPIDLKLALISYLLSLAIFIPISGWVADKFGIKRVFMTAVGVFTLSSVWCGLTDSLTGLIMARVAQGLGGSLTLPVGRLIILRTCERHELISKMSIVVMVAALGMMLGPVLGGIITHNASWRWIFFVNIPVGILTLLMSVKWLPFIPPCAVPPLDKFGFVLFGSGLATLTYGLATLSESDIENGESILVISLAVFLLLYYTWHSRNKAHPIANVSLLSCRTFRVSALGNLLSRTGFGGVPFLLPLLLQISLGYSPQLSGMLLAPTALGVLLIKPMSLPILRVLGYKQVLILNTFLVGLSLCSFALINESTPIWFIALLTFLYGFLISMQYTAMNSLAYANIAQRDTGAATSIMSTIQQLAQSFGVAIAAILVRFFTADHSNPSSLTLHTFHQTFIAMGALTLISVTIFSQLKKEDGVELIEAPEKSDNPA